jgi:phosphatidylserine decarboxylase
MPHQFIQRRTGRVVDERLTGDRAVRWLYSTARERLPPVFRALTSSRASKVLAWLSYDARLGARLTGAAAFLAESGVDLSEVLEPERLTRLRDVFERKIRFWDTRPMPTDLRVVVSPADARVLLGSLESHPLLFLKEKFFCLEELLDESPAVIARFRRAAFAVFRLTPERYHYTHVPIAGRVLRRSVVDGTFHACNPAAIVREVTPLSKNRRVVTLFDTDVPGGTGVGRVAMVEIVALLVGDLVSCYSDERYDGPRALSAGDFALRGQPMSLFRPGSSTVVLLFEPGRVRFDDDLVQNLHHPSARSRFSHGFGQPLVETEVWVRSSIAAPITEESPP